LPRRAFSGFNVDGDRLVLTEEALVLFAFFGACVLLVLGTLELVWPTRSRHLVRRPYPPITSLQRRGRTAPRRGYRAETAPSPASVDLETLPAGTTLEEPAAPVEPPRAAVEHEVPRVEVDAVSVEPAAGAEPVMPTTAAPQDPAVQRCFALYQDGRYAEVIDEATTALRPVPPFFNDAPAAQYAALSGMIGLARQALGDREGARAALLDAVSRAPAPDRSTWARHLGALALATGRELIERAQDEGEDHVRTLRAAVDWLDAGRAVAPDDTALERMREGARAELWRAYEQTIGTLLQRQDFQAARGLIAEALAEATLPAPQRAAFDELFATTFSGEIGQLTADAIRSMQDDDEVDALASLARAERLLASVPDAGITGARHVELDRRLWWGYTTIGARRIETGDYEGALEPLARALTFTSVGEARLQETRAAIRRALQGLTDERVVSIRELAREGQRDNALAQAEKLWAAVLHGSLEVGLDEKDIAAALDRARQLFKELGRQ
jgi:tetratricopeptide (TPR) repeat protein